LLALNEETFKPKCYAYVKIVMTIIGEEKNHTPKEKMKKMTARSYAGVSTFT